MSGTYQTKVAVEDISELLEEMAERLGFDHTACTVEDYKIDDDGKLAVQFDVEWTKDATDDW